MVSFWLPIGMLRWPDHPVSWGRSMSISYCTVTDPRFCGLGTVLFDYQTLIASGLVVVIAGNFLEVSHYLDCRRDAFGRALLVQMRVRDLLVRVEYIGLTTRIFERDSSRGVLGAPRSAIV